MKHKNYLLILPWKTLCKPYETYLKTILQLDGYLQENKDCTLTEYEENGMKILKLNITIN